MYRLKAHFRIPPPHIVQIALFEKLFFQKFKKQYKTFNLNFRVQMSENAKQFLKIENLKYLFRKSIQNWLSDFITFSFLLATFRCPTKKTIFDYHKLVHMLAHKLVHKQVHLQAHKLEYMQALKQNKLIRITLYHHAKDASTEQEFSIMHYSLPCGKKKELKLFYHDFSTN